MTDPNRTSNEHNNAPAVPQGEQATIAGLDAANGHLSILLDDSVLMLKQLRQMVDALHERWSNGGKPERGEFELLDRVDDWLSCRPVSMLSPPTPAPAPAQEAELTDDERQQVFRNAENRMVSEINLSWRNAVVDEVISALRAKGQV